MSIQAIVEQPPKSENRREAARWRIRLELPGTFDKAQANVVIHDISTAGLRVEIRTKLKVGQEIILPLPEADKVAARVVWQNEPLFGCRFVEALPQAVVSAVRLRNPDRDGAKSVNESVHGPAETKAEEKIAEGLPDRLRRLRRESGLSRVALCERTGFSKPTIWGWETGRTTPRKDNLLVLADIFGLTEQQLLFGEGDSTLRKAAAPLIADASAETLAHAIQSAKARIARAAGVNPSKVQIHIEF